jgi:hypothetical protein
MAIIADPTTKKMANRTKPDYGSRRAFPVRNEPGWQAIVQIQCVQIRHISLISNRRINAIVWQTAA